jgi:hypothetical protein
MKQLAHLRQSLVSRHRHVSNLVDAHLQEMEKIFQKKHPHLKMVTPLLSANQELLRHHYAQKSSPKDLMGYLE